MRRRFIFLLFSFLFLVGFLSFLGAFWLRQHPEWVAQKANQWAQTYVKANPLADSADLTWKGLTWNPWFGISLDSVFLGTPDSHILVRGLRLRGLGYSRGVLQADSLVWDSLYVQGIPQASWGHWFDPWIDTSVDQSSMGIAASHLSGRIAWAPSEHGEVWVLDQAWSDVAWNHPASPGITAQILSPWSGWSPVALSGQWTEFGIDLSLSSQEFTADAHMGTDPTQPMVQWDFVGIPWGASASGVLVGDSTWEKWNALGTQAFWRDRTWFMTGEYVSGQWSAQLFEKEGDEILAALRARGDLHNLAVEGDWDSWRGEVLDSSLTGMTLDGEFSFTGAEKSSGAWIWNLQAMGPRLELGSRTLSNWSISGEGDLRDFTGKISVQNPVLGVCNIHAYPGREEVHFDWAWDERMTYLDSLGLPAKGKISGFIGWSKGGYAHIENALNPGFSPLALDWTRDAKGKHQVDLRLGDYRAGGTFAHSPLTWSMPTETEWESMLSAWLDGRWTWFTDQGIEKIWAESPDWTAQFAMNQGYQRIEAQSRNGDWTFSSAAPMKGLRPIETHLDVLAGTEGTGSATLVSRANSADALTLQWNFPEWESKGRIMANLDRRPGRWTCNLSPSSMSLLGHHSALLGGHGIQYDWQRERLSLGDGLAWRSPVGSFGISGALSPEPYEVLRVQWSDLAIKDWTARWIDENPLEGRVYGQIILAGAVGAWNTSADVWIPDLIVEGQSLGAVESQWDVNIETGQVSMRAQAGWGDSLWLTARGSRQDRWDIEMEIDRFPVPYLAPFTEGSIERWAGSFSAELILREQPRRWNLLGKGSLDDLAFHIPITGVTYMGSPRVQFRQGNISLDGELYDSQRKGKVQVSGGYSYQAPAGKSVDLRLEGNRFLALDRLSGDDFYGQVMAQGQARLTGGFEGLRLEVQASPLDSSVFVLPMDAPVTLEDVGFIQFKTRQQSPQILRSPARKAERDFQFDFGLSLQVTPAITARMILDETVGDVLEGKGSGELRIDYPSSGDLAMNGTVTLQEGTYLFTLENLINKPFVVEPGATLSWTGDPYHAGVQLTALYKTRTNPSAYLGLTSQERLPVDVKLVVSGDLMQPDLGFDISLPTAGSAIQAALQSRLVTPDEKTTQVLSILTLHSFWDQGQGWSATGVSAVETNTTQVLAQQFSNFMTQGLGENWDIQLAYANDPKAMQRQMDASIGRSFLDNRLKVMTEWGIPMGTQQSSMGLGDITLTYQLSEDGRWTATAYSVRNSDMAFTGQPVAQKQGLGIQAQWMGDNWRALWVKLFPSGGRN